MSLRSFMMASLACAGLAACASPTAGSPSSADDVAVVPGEASEELTSKPNDLTATQQTLVLKLIDDVCGDSWCEGDHDFKFAKLTCSYAAKSCTITLDIIDPPDGAKPQRDLWRSCKMTSLPAFASIVDTAANGYQSLSPGFYGKVDACIAKLEGHLPPR